MSKENELLATESIGKLFIKLSIPAILAQLVNLLYNIIDRIFIGRIDEVGDIALTGVGVCFPIIMFISAFASLVGMGGAPKASIAMGKGSKEEANKILGNSVILTLILAIILTTVILIFNKDLLYAFGASNQTISYATDYMGIYAIGTIFVMISIGLSAFITCQGFSKYSMMCVVIGAMTNIILDPIFIFAFGLGVKGAAIATIISQAVSAILIIRFLLSKNSKLLLNKESMKLDFKIILSCIALGLAPFIMQSTESILNICFNTSLQKYGGDVAVGAMTVCTSLMMFAMLPLQGFTQGAQPIISYNFGAQNSIRVKKAFKLLFVTCLIYSFVYWLILMLFPKTLVSLFTTNEVLIDFAAKALKIYMALVCIFGIQIACQQTFIALGNAPISLFLALLRKVFLLIPLIYIIPLFMENKTNAVFLAEPIADLIAVTTTFIVFMFVFKKTMKKIETSKKEEVLLDENNRNKKFNENI